MRALFVIRELPRPEVSVAGVISGSESLSGTHTSGLLVAEALAQRGHSVGLCILHGQRIANTAIKYFPTVDAGAEWVQDGRVIWLSYGDQIILAALESVGLSPTVWTHLPVTRSERQWLERGRIRGLITVSDTCRMPLLRSRKHAQVGRIYNPLAPVFHESVGGEPARYESHVAVYAGAAGPSKGLHRVLEMWNCIRKIDGKARLLLAGTGRLYGETRQLGRFGLASPAFEARYVVPLVQEHGSLCGAGIEAVGLLSPVELRKVYEGSSLGVVNMNWSEYTETFCCAATEMLATGLPVFSVARGALPETIGRTGGAVLVKRSSLPNAAVQFASLLGNPDKLEAMGCAGRQYVRTEYHLNHIVDKWEQVIIQGSGFEGLSGNWRGPASAQYLAERLAGRLGAPWLIETPAAVLRQVRRMLQQS